MNRRYFLKQTAGIAPFIVAFNPLAAAQKRFLQNLMSGPDYRNRILVLIALNGGNDGLNTAIPIDKYNILSVARPNILIPENKILKLNDSSIFGFHPAMPGLQRLYNDKLLSIVQGVGYPDPEFSHPAGLNIKYRANTEKEGKSGWLGRHLEYQYPEYPRGYPLQSTDGPAAIRYGIVTRMLTLGSEEDLSIGIASISDFDLLSPSAEDDPVGNNAGGENINAVKSVSEQLKLYAPTLLAHAKRQETLSKLYPKPGKNVLADQLKMTAQLIGSGLNTQIYVVNQFGYDTHGEQVEISDSTLGKHASRLHDLSEAITAFEDDLHLMGRQDDVLGMTFSEFGRRIMSKGNGTDHGTAETVILFGTKLKNGIIGRSPDLPSKVGPDDNLSVQFDFRSLYRSVLQGWLGVSADRARAIINQGPDENMDIFKI